MLHMLQYTYHNSVKECTPVLNYCVNARLLKVVWEMMGSITGCDIITHQVNWQNVVVLL
jgi:hypothetical protein